MTESERLNKIIRRRTDEWRNRQVDNATTDNLPRHEFQPVRDDDSEHMTCVRCGKVFRVVCRKDVEFVKRDACTR